MIKRKKIFFSILLTLLLTLSFYSSVFASNSDGTIDSSNKYAWGKNVGWVNFGTNQGNVHITDARLTGYVWDSIYGWINLSPTNAGVMNDSHGNLSGKAWSGGTGFINFTGVVINSSGRFTGQAEGDVFGILNFDCANCSVITDYRSERAAGISNSGFPAPILILNQISTGTPILLPPEVIREINIQNENATSSVVKKPTEFELLLAHFPSFKDILIQLGVNIDNESDIFKKIKNVDFTLSGFLKSSLSLINISNLNVPNPLSLSLDQLSGVPLAGLPAVVKQNIPEEVVFTRGGDSNIDIPADLKVDENGKLNNSIRVTANKIITLVIKPTPGERVDSIIGYLVFKDNLSFNKIKPISVNKDFFTNLINVAYAENSPEQISITDPLNVEDLNVLNKFKYTDPDHDGLYIAEVSTPYSKGEYQIITVLYYKDQASPKVFRLTTLVDPEGYVYQSAGINETRIRNATVSMLKLNEEKNQYELWKSKSFAQKNPQITDQTGGYSFLVPEGEYQLKVEAEGYKTYLSESFTAAEGDSLHGNIELFPIRFKTSYYWMLLISLIILSILFYARRYYTIQVNKL